MPCWFQELVEHYQRSSLEGVFPQLNTTLVTAYKDSLKNIRRKYSIVLYIHSIDAEFFWSWYQNVVFIEMYPQGYIAVEMNIPTRNDLVMWYYNTVEPLYSTIGGVHVMRSCYRRIVVK